MPMVMAWVGLGAQAVEKTRGPAATAPAGGPGDGVEGKGRRCRAAEQFDFWRPVTAIRNAAKNPDPNREPLVNTPAHPDYPSAHCMYSGAAARVLQQLFGGNGVPFRATFGGPNGITRVFPGFAEAEKEVEEARIWGGIHFRTADEHGTALGRQTADLAMQRHMGPLAR